MTMAEFVFTMCSVMNLLGATDTAGTLFGAFHIHTQACVNHGIVRNQSLCSLNDEKQMK